MFEVPFREGAPWRAADDAGRANVVVLGAKLAERVFPGSDAVGKTVSLDGRDYRVVGVLLPWNPVPKFYDTTSGGFANTEDFYVPFTNAIDRQNDSYGNQNCAALPPAGWDGLLASDCIWVQFWAELPTAAAVRNYRAFLYSYAAEQRTLGRFHWPPRVGLHDVSDWMVQQRVVPEQVRVNTLIGLGFLAVCLINAVGLMLAKFGTRAGELGVRRALGGSGADIFLQCLMETALIGLVGGVLGTGLTVLGLTIDRALLAPGAKSIQLDTLTSIDGGMLAIILIVAVVSTVGVGIFPAWRASRLQPAWQLKVR
jgi:putative ABC transport system permease protein